MAIVYKYATVPRSTKLVPPCEDSVIYQTVPMESEDSYSLPVEHRPKPTDLMSSMTARAAQWTRVSYASHQRRILPRVKTCLGQTWNGYAIEDRYSMPTYYMPNRPTPNWALALRNKIQDDKMSFADTIGEWREAVQMMEGGVSIFKKVYRAARNLWRLRHARRAVRRWFVHQFGRSPDSKWELMDAVRADLAIKFGIKPVLNQAFELAEQLNRMLPLKRRLQVTVGVKDSTVKAGTYGGDLRTFYECSTRAIVWVTYDPDSREFTSGNLAEALWAGTRLSFMVDWFWNFGSYLSSFNAMKGVSSLVGVATTRVRITGVDTRNGFGPGYVVLTKGKYLEKTTSRTRFTVPPMPDLPSFALPTTDIVGRLTSAVEVLASMRKRS